MLDAVVVEVSNVASFDSADRLIADFFSLSPLIGVRLELLRQSNILSNPLCSFPYCTCRIFTTDSYVAQYGYKVREDPLY
jgi:hypothetical protein